jgi:hypothetical protein
MVRWHEKCSQRLEELKKEDSLLTTDLIDHFNRSVQALATKL